MEVNSPLKAYFPFTVLQLVTEPPMRALHGPLQALPSLVSSLNHCHQSVFTTRCLMASLFSMRPFIWLTLVIKIV